MHELMELSAAEMFEVEGGNCGGGGFNLFAGIGDFFSGLFDGESLISPTSPLGQIQQQFEMLRLLSEASGLSPLQIIQLQLQG